ncbi:hypothetical protein [Allopseudospirillum japonicum]|nr:hypothetical protein [Allopseudospirillum japonicum]
MHSRNYLPVYAGVGVLLGYLSLWPRLWSVLALRALRRPFFTDPPLGSKH